MTQNVVWGLKGSDCVRYNRYSTFTKWTAIAVNKVKMLVKNLYFTKRENFIEINIASNRLIIA